MLLQILWALLCTALTALLHCAYAYRLVLALRQHGKALHRKHAKAGTLLLYLFMEAVLMLLLLHILEAVIWGVLYYLHPDGLPDFATALYFSLVSYTTIGYGDVLLGPSLRLAGAMEGVAGTFMFGLSVGLMVAILQRCASYQKTMAQE